MLYTAAFDVVRADAFFLETLGEGFGTLTMSKGSGTDLVLTLNSITTVSQADEGGATTFWVWTDPTPSTPGAPGVRCLDHSPYVSERFTSFGATTWAGAVTNALRALAVSAGWSSTPRCTFSASTGFYTFQSATENTSLTWSTATGRKLFGFAGNASSAATNTGSRTPLFVISPTLQAVGGDPSLEWEPRSIGNRVSGDTGQGFGQSRQVSPLHRDWIQQYETKEKAVRKAAASTHPWTFQDLFEHCRAEFPFIVYDAGFNDDDDTSPYVFSFREEGIPWTPERATPGNDAQLHIPFQCVVEGELVTNGAS